MLARFIVIFALAVQSVSFAALDYPTLYAEGAKAQDSGQYLQFVNGLPSSTREDLKVELVQLLTQIRNQPSSQLRTSLNTIFRYFSQSRNDFRTSALVLERRAKLYVDELVGTPTWDAATVADQLIKAVEAYEKSVTFPMLTEMERELAREFPRSNIFFLGRDMSVFDLWARQRGILNGSRMFTANISRRVRDAIAAGQVAELNQMVGQLNLTKESLLRDGIVFIDSSMGGKIPAVVLAALMQGYTDSERYQLLSKTHIRYLRSSSQDGKSIANRTAAYSRIQALTAKEAQNILSERAGIPVFQVGSEDGKYFVGDFEPHNYFEHRMKFVSSAQGLTREGKLIRTTSPIPTALADRVNSILGLMTDINIVEKTAPPAFVNELNKVWKKGRKAASDWEDEQTREERRRFEETNVRELSDKKYPFQLRVGEEDPIKLARLLGEGANVKAYLGKDGTVIKVVKKDYAMRKSLHAVWVARLMDQYKIEVARILSYDPYGAYVEQEHITSESLEELHAKGAVTQEIHDQVITMWNRSKQLAKDTGIFMDLKAGNVHLAPDGRVVNVDYVPRVNSTYWRYYVDEDGKPLTDLQFLDLFYNYDRNKKNLPVQKVQYNGKKSESDPIPFKVRKCSRIF